MTSFPALGASRLRTGRRSAPGQLYLLTTVTWQRRPHFLEAELARAAARTLSAADLWLPSRCLCWVLMPDHWHGLVELGDGTDISSTMQRAKGVTAHNVKLQSALHGPLWAKGFHDRALRRDESVIDVTRYLLANPLRAGLVNDPMDYPYWDAVCITEAAGSGDAWLPDSH
jgi:REP element-mobilizing transposase RayT